MITRTLTAAALAAAVATGAHAGAPVDFYLTVLHNNDGESQLINAGSGLEDFGGVARFKTLTDTLKADAATFPAGASANGVIMISSGDNFLAGPEFNASLEMGPPYFDAIAMEKIGYDAAAIGNHEFDFGPDVLANFISSFSTPLPFVSANLDVSAESALNGFAADRLASSTVITVAGRQVGVVGATTENLPFISSPRDVVINDVLTSVQAEIDALTLSGVDIIILTSHLQGLEEEQTLIANLTGVDAVIGGGGDELLNNSGVIIPGDTIDDPYPLVVQDAAMNDVPLVTTAGQYRYVGRLILGFDASGNLVEINPASDTVRVSGTGADAVAEDPMMLSMVTDPVSAFVADLDATIIATSEVPLNGVRDDIRSKETNQGNLIADALLYNARRLAPAFGVGLADVALANGGGIRNDNVLPAGDLSLLDTFDISPFGNFVSVFEALPAAQFKEIMENAVSRIEAGTGDPVGSGTGRYAQTAGFRMVYDASLPARELDGDGDVINPGERVRSIVLNNGRVIVENGVVVPGAGTVNLATLDFLARGGDQYPFGGAPFTSLGLTDQQSLAEYLQFGLAGLVTEVEYAPGGEGRVLNADPGLPSLAVCPADFDADGVVDAGDLAVMIADWGSANSPCDLNASGLVDAADLGDFIASWGACD